MAGTTNGNGTKPPLRNDHPLVNPQQTQQQSMAKPTWDQPTNKAGLEALSKGVIASVEKALPKFLHGQGERLIRAMIMECQKNPALFDCTPVSLFGCVIGAGQLGLTIGGQLGESYMVPFRNKKNGNRQEAQLIIGYKGFVQLAHRSNQIRRITPMTVREGDLFRVFRGMRQDLVHEPLRNNKGRVTDYYVVIELMNGGSDFETMSVEEAMAHRDRYAMSKSQYSPWYDMTPGGGFDSMAQKTLIRRLAKRMPLSVELNQVVQMEDSLDRETSQIQIAHQQMILPDRLVSDSAEVFDEEPSEPTESEGKDGRLFAEPAAQKMPG